MSSFKCLVRNGQSACDEAGLSNIPVAFVGSAGGVVGNTDLTVQQTGSASAYIQITAGRAYVPNLSVTEPMMYAVYLDTLTSGTGGGNTNNVLIANNATGVTQQDWIVLYINLSASPDAAADNVAAFADVRGTGGSAPTNAQVLAVIGASNPYIVLAQIAVPNGGGSGGSNITTGEITDKRAFAVLNTGQTISVPLYGNFTDQGSPPGAPASGITRMFTESGGVYTIVNGGTAAQIGSTNLTTDSFSATPTIDWSKGNTHRMTLTASVTSSTFSNPTVGQHLTLLITQGGSGSYTWAFPSSVIWPNAIAPTLSTTTGYTDMIGFIWDGTYYRSFSSIGYQH